MPPQLFSRLLTFLGIKRRESSLLVVGLDNSGKTTIMNQLKPKETRVTEVVPTVGFTVEKFNIRNNLSVTAFDMSGQGRYRNLWEHYYRGVEAIIFVIDSSDSLRLVVAKDELDMMTRHPDLKERRIPILFLANKSDLRDSMAASKISQALSLESLLGPPSESPSSYPWSIQTTNALTGEGVEEGIQWLSDQLMIQRS